MIYKAVCPHCGALLKDDNGPFTLDPNSWANTRKRVCWFCGHANDYSEIIYDFPKIKER